MLTNPLDLRGPEFLSLFLGLMWATLVVALFARRSLRLPADEIMPGDEHLVSVKNAGEGQGVGGAERESEMGAVSRNLAEVHPAKAECRRGLHDLRNLGCFLIDVAAGVQEVAAGRALVDRNRMPGAL